MPFLVSFEKKYVFFVFVHGIRRFDARNAEQKIQNSFKIGYQFFGIRKPKVEDKNYVSNRRVLKRILDNKNTAKSFQIFKERL